MDKKGLVLAAAALLAVAAPARATILPRVQSIMGTQCHVDRRTTATWEYRNRRFLNTSTDPWAIAVVVCPVNVILPDARPAEYRIYLTDVQQRAAWCRFYSPLGTQVRLQWANWAPSAGSPFWGTFPSSLADEESVEMSVECLVQSGASLDNLEIVWLEP
jgi:hypothetical protein